MRPRLAQLHQSGASDGQTPVWDAASGRWVPGAPPAALADLADVDTTTTPPTDGQTLVYDDAAGEWVPGDSSGGGSASLVLLTTTIGGEPQLVWDDDDNLIFTEAPQ